MKSKFVKIWFMVAGIFGSAAIIYYIVRLYDSITNPDKIDGTLLDKLNVYAIISLGVALLMLIAIIPLSKKIEEHEAKKASLKIDDNKILEKYKSRKTK